MSRGGPINYYTLRITLLDGRIISPRVEASSDIRALFNLYETHRHEIAHNIKSINIPFWNNVPFKSPIIWDITRYVTN